jgi:uncharacterized RDD family membrane protein YckC
MRRSRAKSLLKKRTIAFAIDLLAISALTKLILVSFKNSLDSLFFHMPLESKLEAIGKSHLMNVSLFMAVFFGYFVFSYYSTNGQSLGKISQNLRLRSKSNKKLKFGEIFLRTFGYFGCMNFSMFLFAIPFFTKTERGIPDWVSKTFVDENLPIEKNVGADIILLPAPSYSTVEIQDEDIAA